MNFGNYLRKAFIATDKATVDQLIADAEKENGNGDDDHKEPDGDEGTHIHLHMEGKDGASMPTSDSARLTKLETGFKDINRKMGLLMDKLGVKDNSVEFPVNESVPPGSITKVGEPEERATDPLKSGGVGSFDQDGNPVPDQLEGAQESETLPSISPELMEADPALNTGRSMMGDAAFNTRVNGALAMLFRETKARAEMLAPGIAMPVFDAAPEAKGRMKIIGKSVCDFRRSALMTAAGSEIGKRALGSYTADSIKGLSCDAVKMLFMATSTTVRDMNNAMGRPNPYQGTADGFGGGGIVDARSFRNAQEAKVKSINSTNADFWKKQRGAA